MEQTVSCKNRKGFTLVELIVVIAVMLILVVLAVAGVRGVLASAASASRVADANSIAAAVNMFNAMVGVASESTPEDVIDDISSMVWDGNRLLLQVGAPFHMDISVTVNGGQERLNELIPATGTPYLFITTGSGDIPFVWVSRGDANATPSPT